jgi:hypothetical protein
MSTKFPAVIFTCLILVTGLPGNHVMARDNPAEARAAQTARVAMLLFDEEEPGTGVYPVRYLISDAYLRIDDGHDASDYILLDRSSSVIYSVSHEYGNILVIHRQPPGSLPEDLKLAHEPVPDTEAPSIAGKQPRQYRYLANGELCYEAVLVPGLMTAAVEGLAEYELLLGRQQATKLESTPAQLRTPCFLSRYIHAPGRHLEQGLPIQVWDDSGYRQTLVNFSDRTDVSTHLFEVPSEYQEVTIGIAAD